MDLPVMFQKILNEQWLQLISDIRSIYSGKLVWATKCSSFHGPPCHHFINMTDALYITIDSPIASTSDPSLEDLSYNFEAVINTQIYETYESTQKPIIIALAYPSIEGASTGCTLLDSDCSNDGVFLEDEVADRIVNLDEQVLILQCYPPYSIKSGLDKWNCNKRL